MFEGFTSQEALPYFQSTGPGVAWPIDVCQGGGNYVVCAQLTDYHTDMGLMACPQAAPASTSCTNPVVISRRHTGITWKIVRWVMARVNDRPSLPSPTPLNDNEVLFDEQVGGHVPSFMPDGQPLWCQRGLYLYVCRCRRNPGEGFEIGASPINTVVTAAQLAILPEDFKLFLTGPAPRVSSGGSTFVP